MCEAFWDLFGFGWWLGGAIVLTNSSKQADSATPEIPNSSYRAGLLAMCWLSMALFLLMFIVNVVMVFRINKTLANADREVAKDVMGDQGRVATAV